MECKMCFLKQSNLAWDYCQWTLIAWKKLFQPIRKEITENRTFVPNNYEVILPCHEASPRGELYSSLRQISHLSLTAIFQYFKSRFCDRNETSSPAWSPESGWFLHSINHPTRPSQAALPPSLLPPSLPHPTCPSQADLRKDSPKTCCIRYPY